MDNLSGLQLYYFVLSPTKDNAYGKASRAAIRKYAKEIRDENPTLSFDLLRWMYVVDKKLKTKPKSQT